MGVIVLFPQIVQRRARNSRAGAENAGEILFFTGVRIERHAESEVVEAGHADTRPASDGTSGGRRRRKA